MHRDLVRWLSCPACRADLALTAARDSTCEDVEQAELRCLGCSAEYPVRRGVPRFVRNDGEVGNFSFEWNRWSRVQLDCDNGTTESEDTFREKTGLEPRDLEGRLVLDVGCGAGRFLDVASRWGARVIGVDLSFAVEAARRNLRDRPGVDVVQADVFALPFKPGVFDVVFSIGVLHHTPDTRSAFLQLPPLLRDGGRVAVWLYYYTDKVYCRATDFWRTLLKPLPHRLLYAWCAALVASLSNRPALMRRPWSHLYRVVPVNTHPNRQWRVLDTFDWYSPRYQDKACSPVRVAGWMREAQLRQVAFLDRPTAVRATRGSASDPFYEAPLMDVRGRRILVFGAGSGGDEAFGLLERAGLSSAVVAVCDNAGAKQGGVFHGHVVRGFSAVERDEYDVALIASQPGRSAISAQLREAGLTARVDYATVRYALEIALPLLVAETAR